MDINGLIAETDGEGIVIRGFTGNDLCCEGCGKETPALYETDDSVMLCGECFRDCREAE